MVIKKRSLLHETVVEELYKLIDQNQILPGGQFPSETELTARWDVSRNVIREGFHILQSRGVVISKQGKGRFLREFPEHKTWDRQDSLSKNLERYSLLEVLEVRRTLECCAVRLVANNVTEKDIADIQCEYEALKKRFFKNKNTSGEFKMHHIYTEKSNNSYLKQMLAVTRNIILDMMSHTFREILNTHSVEESIEDHGRLLVALRQHNSVLAEEIMFDHLQKTIDMLE